MSNNKMLHLAVEFGNYNDVVTLVRNGLDINLDDMHGFTPLHKAVKLGHKKIVKFLITHGADIEEPDYYNIFYPIHSAAKYGHLQILKLLIDHGVDVDKRARFGYSLLHAAAEGGYVQVIRYLLAIGMDVDELDSHNSTPFTHVVSLGKREIVEFLFSKGANINHKDNSYYTPLHYACIAGREEVVKFLIAKGALLNETCDRDQTCLELAVQYGHKGIVELLIKNGATYALIDGAQCANLLRVAVKFGQTALVEYFLEGKEVIDFLNPCDENILHIASRRGHLKLVEFLINKGVNVNSKSLSEGNTPLHYSSESVNPRVTELLIHKGAHIEAKNKYGCIPLDLVFNSSFSTNKNERNVIQIILKYMLLQNKDLRSNFFEYMIPYDYLYFRELIKFCYDCEREIQEMETLLLQNTTVSLGKVLRAMYDESRLVKYLCNENIRNHLEHIENYCKSLSIYSNIYGLIKFRIEKAVKRQQLLEQASVNLDNFTPKLPVESKLRIFSYLSSEDLHTFVKSF